MWEANRTTTVILLTRRRVRYMLPDAVPDGGWAGQRDGIRQHSQLSKINILYNKRKANKNPHRRTGSYCFKVNGFFAVRKHAYFG